jgi:broad specificity phosphatase PhoE
LNVARVWLVRHAEPLEAIGVDPDLTERGVRQAAGLVDALRPCALLTSPLLRARSTARPLEEAWGIDALVEPAVREVPSPTTTVAQRQVWLRLALRGTFAELDEGVAAWRKGVGEILSSRREDTVILTHAVVINAAVGLCTGDERVFHMRPAHVSVTTFDVDSGGSLTLVERGREVESFVV